jgi:hypothetical protein
MKDQTMRRPPANPRKFQKGQSGNPGGRPKIPPDVKEAARGMSPEAIDTLGEVMRDRKQPGAARVEAANSILDRAWGKPQQHITTGRIEQLSDQELAEELEITLQAIKAIAAKNDEVTYRVVDGA